MFCVCARVCMCECVCACMRVCLMCGSACPCLPFGESAGECCGDEWLWACRDEGVSRRAWLAKMSKGAVNRDREVTPSSKAYTCSRVRDGGGWMGGDRGVLFRDFGDDARMCMCVLKGGVYSGIWETTRSTCMCVLRGGCRTGQDCVDMHCIWPQFCKFARPTIPFTSCDYCT